MGNTNTLLAGLQEPAINRDGVPGLAGDAATDTAGPPARAGIAPAHRPRPVDHLPSLRGPGGLLNPGVSPSRAGGPARVAPAAAAAAIRGGRGQSPRGVFSVRFNKKPLNKVWEGSGGGRGPRGAQPPDGGRR
jgi:hypothetical protein